MSLNYTNTHVAVTGTVSTILTVPDHCEVLTIQNIGANKAYTRWDGGAAVAEQAALLSADGGSYEFDKPRMPRVGTQVTAICQTSTATTFFISYGLTT